MKKTIQNNKIQFLHFPCFVGVFYLKQTTFLSEHWGVPHITNSLAKGLVFGVLDVQQGEIIWLEMPFSGQIVQNLDAQNTEALLKKLGSKLTIGQLLEVKAEAQGMFVTSTADADEIYTAEWGRNTAAVTQLLVD